MTEKSLKAQQIVEAAMHKFKRGMLKSGISGAIVKGRKQAIAIGLSEAHASTVSARNDGRKE
jgi:hypothetical protein